MRTISSPCGAPAVSPTPWWGIQSKKAHLLQGLQTLLRDRKNWGLHLQIASLFFEPVKEKKPNCCHNLDREENKWKKIYSKMDERSSFLSLENCYWRRDKGFDLHIKTELGEDTSNKNKSATVLKVGTSVEAWEGTLITEQLKLV